MKFLLLLLLAFAMGCSSAPENGKEYTTTTVLKDSMATKEHVFTKLSNENDYNLIFHFKYKHQNTEDDYCIIKVLDKKTNAIIDSIRQNMSTLLSRDTIVESRSYITGENANKQVQDNFYGTIVVADFNFDKKEDFAIMNDVGASTGGIYTYYVQTANKKFIIDTFLSDTMVFFPDKIDADNKTLTTLVHANAREIGENKYKLNTQTGRWKEISHRYIPYE